MPGTARFWKSFSNYQKTGNEDCKTNVQEFIEALVYTYQRYEEKRWVTKDGRQPPVGHEQRDSVQGQRPVDKISECESPPEERKKSGQSLSSRYPVPRTRIGVPLPPRGQEQVTHAPKLTEVSCRQCLLT
ncbi:hypothetical protein MLD38_000654 [Melastoma candidum]|uniref:Uncharacterized protein n=1 Tax=Melastoma candidum TaxID=119954 RepID=A0ACB9SCC2_9MYRT|nr:hypothetical protein MLD38_000654 [Melastoma candidum]